MPLFVGQRQINYGDFKSSGDLMKYFPELEKTSKTFSYEEATKFPGKKILYIGQHEYGTVDSNDCLFDVIGSDSATTCQIVVLRHKGACSLAHIDGSGIEKALREMIGTLQELAERQGEMSPRFELYIVGGFLDRCKTSENIFMEILYGAMKLSVNVHLVCACVCALNDSFLHGQHIPKIYGIGVDVSSGHISPILEQFNCQIPDQVLRHAALYDKKQGVRQIYHSIHQELRVAPFNNNFEREYAKKIANLPHDVILRKFSTSPHCEPANFVKKFREVFSFLADNENIRLRYFPHENFRRFRANQDGIWVLVEVENSP